VFYSFLPVVCSVPCSFAVLYFTNGQIIINSPANAWSSFAYAAIDAPLCIKYPLFILSVASFNLWSCSTIPIDIIDVSSIFWVNMVVVIYILPDAEYKYRLIYLLNTILTILVVYTISIGYENYVFEYYRVNMIQDIGIVYVYSGIILSSYYAKDANFLFGLFCVVVGFICKIFDIYTPYKKWGTSIFHMLTALGIHFMMRIKSLNYKPASAFFLQNTNDCENEGMCDNEPVFNSMHIQPK
jgi:hypothetical protein